MFERYTEHARRVIFFARYEASKFGSGHIETEHFLLGILREDRTLAGRFLTDAAIRSIREQVEGHAPVREKISVSGDLPMSQACRRILAYGCEESERLGHKHIGTEHLFIGILKEKKGFASEILRERGLQLAAVREELWYSQETKAVPPDLAVQFGRFTESALRATCFALQEASESGSAAIEIEHLLLGILREDKLGAARVLRSDGAAIRLAIEAQCPPHAECPGEVDLVITRGYLEILALACREATGMGQEKIGIGHLLLGILHDEDGLPAQILRAHGVTSSSVRADLAAN